jgi:hypothetical protein
MKTGLDTAEKTGMPGFNIWFPPPPAVEAYRAKMFPNDQDPLKGRTELK